MALFTQTRHKGPGRFLRVKIWLFSVAAILMLVGMARAIDPLIITAIVLLAIAFVLRFFEKEDEDEEMLDDEEDFADEEDVAEDDADPAALPPAAGTPPEFRPGPAAEAPRRRWDDGET